MKSDQRIKRELCIRSQILFGAFRNVIEIKFEAISKIRG